MKRVQHEATREKVQHEKSATVKYAKKKSAQEKYTRVHKWITGSPLTYHYTLVKRFKFSASWWTGNENHFCFLLLLLVAFYFKVMPNLIDFGKNYLKCNNFVRIIGSCPGEELF